MERTVKAVPDAAVIAAKEKLSQKIKQWVTASMFPVFIMLLLPPVIDEIGTLLAVSGVLLLMMTAALLVASKKDSNLLASADEISLCSDQIGRHECTRNTFRQLYEKQGGVLLQGQLTALVDLARQEDHLARVDAMLREACDGGQKMEGAIRG